MASLSFAMSGVGADGAAPIVVGAGIGCGGLGGSCCGVDGTTAAITSHSTTTIAAAARTLRKAIMGSVRMSQGFNAEETIRFPMGLNPHPYRYEMRPSRHNPIRLQRNPGILTRQPSLGRSKGSKIPYIYIFY